MVLSNIFKKVKNFYYDKFSLSYKLKKQSELEKQAKAEKPVQDFRIKAKERRFSHRSFKKAFRGGKPVKIMFTDSRKGFKTSVCKNLASVLIANKQAISI